MNATTFDVFLRIHEDGNLGNKDLYNYIRNLRREKEKSKVFIVKKEKIEEELLPCDLQPTDDPKKSKSQLRREQLCFTVMSPFWCIGLLCALCLFLVFRRLFDMFGRTPMFMEWLWISFTKQLIMALSSVSV